MFKPLSVASHRNGISGNSFHVVLFTEKDYSPDPFVGIVFEEEYTVAVLNVKLLADGNIRFGENSWRGDEFEPHLRKAIAKED